MWEASKHMHCKIQLGFFQKSAWKNVLNKIFRIWKLMDRIIKLKCIPLIYFAEFTKKRNNLFSELQMLDFWSVSYTVF